MKKVVAAALPQMLARSITIVDDCFGVKTLDLRRVLLFLLNITSLRC